MRAHHTLLVSRLACAFTALLPTQPSRRPPPSLHLWLPVVVVSAASSSSSSSSLTTKAALPQQRQQHGLTMSSSSTTTCNSDSNDNNHGGGARRTTAPVVVPEPPVAHRDETDHFYLGVAPPHWDSTIPRQAADSTQALVDPPVAIANPYGWMRDTTRSNPAVLDHLQRENDYTQQVTAPLSQLQHDLYHEFLSRIQETDHSVPRPLGPQSPWLVYSRTFEGLSYPVYCRAPQSSSFLLSAVNWDGSATSPIVPGEQVLINVNELADGHDYCVVEDVESSPSHTLVAYTIDFVGEERYALHIQPLSATTGNSSSNAEDEIATDLDGSIVWGHTDDYLFYIKVDENTRPYQVYRRRIRIHDGATTTEDEDDEEELLLFEELDEAFFVGIHKTLDEKYLIISSESSETSEVHYLALGGDDDTTNNKNALHCICPRQHKVLYQVDHRQGIWWIQSNLGGLTNFALFTVPVGQSQDSTHWKLVVANNNKDNDAVVLFDGSNQRSLDDVTCFQSHVVVQGREDSLPRIWILTLDDDQHQDNRVHAAMTRLEFDEPAFDVGVAANYDYTAASLLIAYDSLTTPTQYWEIQFHDVSQRTLVKERRVAHYDKHEYETQRVWVTARDGITSLPVDLLYRKHVMETFRATGQPVPVHMYGTFVVERECCTLGDTCVFSLCSQQSLMVLSQLFGFSCP